MQTLHSGFMYYVHPVSEVTEAPVTISVKNKNKNILHRYRYLIHAGVVMEECIK